MFTVYSFIHSRSCKMGGCCVKSPPAHPKDCQWGSGLDSVVAHPSVKMMSHTPWSTPSQFEPAESWHCHLGICPRNQGRKNPLMDKPGHSVCSGSWMTWQTESSPDTAPTGLMGASLHPPLFLPWWAITLEQSKSGFIGTTQPFSIAPESRLYAT